VTISVIRGAVVVVLATIALIALLELSPGRRPLLLSIYLLVLGAVALRLLVRLVALAHPPGPPSELDAALRRRPDHLALPAELESIARMLTLSSASGVYVTNRLRPEVRAIAREVLISRQGIDLDAEPVAARGVLGPTVWELLRPDRPAPDDYKSPGLAPPVLAAIVAELEEVPER
jgi:hypothetical protein